MIYDNWSTCAGRAIAYSYLSPWHEALKRPAISENTLMEIKKLNR
jgi:hypothetical protein